MAESLSLLQRATVADVRLAPFPHIVITEALPSALCDALLAQYPAVSTMNVDLRANNARWSYSATQSLNDPAVSPLWHQFIDYHSSTAFYQQLAALFEQPLSALYGPAPAAFRTGVRHRNDYTAADILLDAQICGNTPVSQASSVRGAHVDRINKLFAGLYYLRPDDDNTPGGDLEIYQFRANYATPAERRDYYHNVNVSIDALDTVARVPYRKNTLIIFINSALSLHGVSVRQPTRHSRLFVNLLGEVKQPLFTLPRPRLKKRLQRLLSAAH